MSYRVEFLPSARRDIRGLALDIRARLVARLSELADDPRPRGTEELKGPLRGFRKLRVGMYRAVYRVDDLARTATVWGVGHRSVLYGRMLRRAGAPGEMEEP